MDKTDLPSCYEFGEHLELLEEFKERFDGLILDIVKFNVLVDLMREVGFVYFEEFRGEFYDVSCRLLF